MDHETLETLMGEIPDLELAKLHWKLGHPLPVDLSTTLIAQGHDLSELEARYSI